MPGRPLPRSLTDLKLKKPSFSLKFNYFQTMFLFELEKVIPGSTDYGRPERKSPYLNGRKSTPTPKFLGRAEAYFVCHIGPNFQISLIYAFIGCP